MCIPPHLTGRATIDGLLFDCYVAKCIYSNVMTQLGSIRHCPHGCSYSQYSPSLDFFDGKLLVTKRIYFQELLAGKVDSGGGTVVVASGGTLVVVVVFERGGMVVLLTGPTQ